MSLIFSKIKLGELGKVSMCKRILKHETSEFEEIPFYKISTFGGKADTFISREIYELYKQKYSYPKIGDVLFSAAGTIGKTVIYDGAPAFFQDSNIVWIDNNESIILNRFLYYFYQTKPWITSKGSTILRLYNDNIRSIEINYPDINIQEKIAKVLSSLDSKIELNNRINAELEAMAKTIYDYWFMQFEFPCLPHDYRPSGQVNPNNELSEKIRAFCTYKQTGGLPLPDGKKWFVYVLLCEDGSFYKGMTNDLYRRYYEHKTGQGAEHTKVHKPRKVIHWEVFPSQSEAAAREKELKTGFGRTWLQREYEYLQKNKPGSPAHQNARLSKLMPAGKMVWNEELKREIPEGWEVKKFGDVVAIKNGRDHKHLNNGSYPVFGSGGVMRQSDSFLYDSESILIPRKGSLGNLFYINEPFWCVDTIFYTQMKIPQSCKYLFYTTQNFNIAKMNTGTAVPSMTTEILNNLTLVFPPTNTLISFDDLLNPIFKKKNKINIENQQLAELRDWLLPMLMNGQVRVK